MTNAPETSHPTDATETDHQTDAAPREEAAPSGEAADERGQPAAADAADVDVPAADGTAEDPDPGPDPEERAAEDGRSPGELLVALESTSDERDDYLDALQRSRAEFDNFRRRSQREAAGARRAGVGDLASSLLEVLDDLDRTAAVAAVSQDEGLAAGIGAVHRKLVDALVAAGVERVDEVDVPFDANRHEAVQQIPADEPVDAPVVAEVLRPGYLHGDRCLRAAMVVVRQ